MALSMIATGSLVTNLAIKNETKPFAKTTIAISPATGTGFWPFPLPDTKKMLIPAPITIQATSNKAFL
jgi:hypothetical protein